MRTDTGTLHGLAGTNPSILCATGLPGIPEVFYQKTGLWGVTITNKDMKRALLIILLLWPLLSMAQKADFSGKWNISSKKTDISQVPDWLPTRSFEIKQKNDEITIAAKFYDDQMTQHYYTETLPFDGTEVETITYGDNKRFVSLKWRFDDKSFTLSVRPATSDGSTSADFSETWSLENDGKTLVVERNATQANGYHLKAYYDKK